jgi:hypothetical protein
MVAACRDFVITLSRMQEPAVRQRRSPIRLPALVVLPTLVLVGLAVAGCGESASERAAKAREAEQAQEQARTVAAAAREARRLADLWTYHDVPAGQARQLTASIYSGNDVETGGQGARRVQLVFRDHPSWGRSSYLVLQNGDFACPKCTVAVVVDDQAPTRMAARRPPTDEAIALFIDDARALWRLTAGARRLSIEFPVKAGGTRTATFDVPGLDRSKLPGWD